MANVLAGTGLSSDDEDQFDDGRGSPAAPTLDPTGLQDLAAKRASPGAAQAAAAPPFNSTAAARRLNDDLFGSDGDDGATQRAYEHQQSSPRAGTPAIGEEEAMAERTSREQVVGDDFELAPLGNPAPAAFSRPRSAPEVWQLPLTGRPERDVHILTFKTMLDIERAEYRPEEFTLEERVEIDDNGRRVPQAPALNRIRWRVRRGTGGASVLESNARLVRWDDGSMSLFLGGECVDLTLAPLRDAQMLLGVHHEADCVIQGQCLVSKRLALAPPPVDSRLHQQLAAHHSPSKVNKASIKASMVLADYSREHEEALGREAEAHKLSKRQERAGRRRAAAPLPTLPPSSRSLAAASRRMTAAELEAESDEDDYDEPDAPGGGLQDLAAARHRADAREEEAAERRLMQAKRGQDAKRKRLVLEDDDDEDVELSDDDGPAPSPTPGGGVASEPSSKRHYALVDSDDD